MAPTEPEGFSLAYFMGPFLVFPTCLHSLCSGSNAEFKYEGHSVGLLFLYGALDSHPFFPSHVASGRYFLSAAAGAPAGVVSAFAEPSGWCVGAVLDVA